MPSSRLCSRTSATAEDLRNSVDGWDFKNYVLGTMFYRYISENLCNYINAPAAQIADFFFCTSRLDDFKTIMGRETNITMISLLNLLIILVARSVKQKQEAQASAKK